MDVRQLIIIAGGILVVLAFMHAVWSATRRRPDSLRIKIDPKVVSEADDVDEDWLGQGFIDKAVAPKSPEVPGNDPLQRASQADDQAEQDLFGGDVSSEPAGDESEAAQDSITQDEAQDAEGSIEAEEPLEEVGSDLSQPGSGAGIEPLPATEDAAEASAQDAADGELVVMHVVAQGGRFAGEELLSVLRDEGLKYGDMRIFHRFHQTSGRTVFSIANAIEPGYFDLAGDCSLPGVTAFMKLPGPENAAEALEDMLRTMDSIARKLNGLTLDSNRESFTDQIASSYRDRVAALAHMRTST